MRWNRRLPGCAAPARAPARERRRALACAEALPSRSRAAPRERCSDPGSRPLAPECHRRGKGTWSRGAGGRRQAAPSRCPPRGRCPRAPPPRDQVRVRRHDAVVAHRQQRDRVNLEVQVYGVPCASPVLPTKPITCPARTSFRRRRAARRRTGGRSRTGCPAGRGARSGSRRCRSSRQRRLSRRRRREPALRAERRCPRRDAR